tara:strand:+ start:1104 stop:1274 length:171 start_codon:yes stop_codon:yes gene_type:complete
MSSKQTSFFLMVSAFIVALLIVYFELKRNNVNNFTEKCKDDTDCAPGLKCVNDECQ